MPKNQLAFKLKGSDLKRFISFVGFAGESECWIWQGSTNGGRYGKFSLIEKGKKVCPSAHRTMFQLVNKIKLKSHQYVCHACDNTKCCNPNHLFLGDAKINQEDCIAKGRNLTGEKHPRSVLTNEICHKIIDLRLFKEITTKEIAKRVNLKAGVVQRLLNGSRWKVPEIQKRIEENRQKLGEIMMKHRFNGLAVGWNRTKS